MKICLTSQIGGHLFQLLQLKSIYEKYEFFFVTSKHESTRNLENAYYLHFNYEPRVTLNMIIDFILNTIKSVKIINKERPKIIVTTGGHVSLPICIIGKIFGSKLIYIESFSRMNSKSLSGKIIYNIADVFLVQWKSMLNIYGKKAQYWGKLL
jgi:UDP-N-acetylglucosamine:LPS N-acetylglucosamine transferase